MDKIKHVLKEKAVMGTKKSCHYFYLIRSKKIMSVHRFENSNAWVSTRTEFDGLVLKFFDGHFLKMYVI